jgi:hypothetical protein
MQYQLIALVPMGYPADGFKRPMRKPVFPRIHDERWDRLADSRGTAGQIAILHLVIRRPKN